MQRGFPGGSVVKKPPAMRGHRFEAWVGKIPWRREWQPTPVFLPGKLNGQRSWQTTVQGVEEESDMTY